MAWEYRGAAEALARRAHEGQTDKAGRPYIEHVERVAAAMKGDDWCEAVAWLHDVLEDCPDFAAEVEDCFPWGIWVSVRMLTRKRDQRAEDYYAAIAIDPIALRVKLADIADNADESRLALLDEGTAGRLRRKYATALAYLGNPASLVHP